MPRTVEVLLVLVSIKSLFSIRKVSKSIDFRFCIVLSYEIFKITHFCRILVLYLNLYAVLFNGGHE